jgi:hypothetical protein
VLAWLEPQGEPFQTTLAMMGLHPPV